MNLNYLSTLTNVHNNTQNNYTVIENKNDNYKSVIMDEVNFSGADLNDDDFLTYDELYNIKLTPDFNLKNNQFELKRGFDLLSHDSIRKIYDESGLSLELLMSSLEKLDKDKNNKITSDEINPNLTKTIDAQKRAYRTSIIENLNQNINSDKENASENKAIRSLEKQIENLKKMLQTFKTEQSTVANNPEINNTKDIASTSIDKKIAVDGLKDKYGSDDTNKLISTISRVPNAAENVSRTIYQSGTKASEKEVKTLATLMQSTALNKISVEQISDMNAIEQLSPASIPVVIDEQNANFSVSSIEQKIQDLEQMKGKILQKKAEDIF